MIKYFRFSWDFVLWELTWVNMNMLLATIPDYGLGDDDEREIEAETPADLKNFLNL